ncbi:MAG: hypothetical protein GWO20_01000 [Candidatus Korarchaeota archaeon]|nr:hypothetical protein [Candidatus Korarchaeota archaeon]NIU82869.1 hypothetical protein [Candidatus Thorarchaeota archaeon]NIW12563.1 hypothetical protein [Candidatus Thorarchaeota archaeon]NIW50783.1 hypothetical protein [Candidatus Korarchaeota archaeon]
MSYEPLTGDLFHRLVEAWNAERESEKLQELDEELLSNIKNRIDTVKDKLNDKQENKGLAMELAQKEIDIVEFIVNDLVRLRTVKIFEEAIEDTFSERLLPEERSFASAIKEKIGSLKGRLASKEGTSLSSLRLDEKVKKHINKKHKELALISANKPIESFVTEDGIVYRNIKRGDILNIPKKNLNLFLKRDKSIFDVIKTKSEET